MNIEYQGRRVDGIHISPHEASKAPNVTYTPSEGKVYTLLMFDPEAVGGNRIHWLVINSTTTLFPYVGPNPPPDSTHHYHFVLIEQEEPITKRIHLKTRQISLETLLKKLGMDGTMVDEKYFTSSYSNLLKKIPKSTKTTKPKNSTTA